MRRELNLAGSWRFRLDPKRLGEHYPDQLNYTHLDQARWMEPGHDDSGWDSIPVPAHWQTAGYAYNGPAWYRTTFDLPEQLEPDGQLRLEFAGVDYFADVWLNGRFLGSHEGYFGAFGFDITPYLRQQNVLAVRVDSPLDALGEEHELGQAKTIFKGALARWDMNDPEVNPGGIWNDVRLLVSGPLQITGLRLTAMPDALPVMGNPDQLVSATTAVNLEVYATTAQAGCRLRVDILATAEDGPIASIERGIAMLPGVQTISLDLHLREARLWWTWDLGEPVCYRARIRLISPSGESEEVIQSFGIRRIERGEGSSLLLNGVPLFQRGANYLSDQLLSTMTPARYARDIQLLRDASLNTVHTFCVVERDEFYQQCDRAGLLVYQDFPMWLTMDGSSDLVRRGVAQVHELIAQYGHHPSIGIWNFGSQPSVANFEKLCSALATTARELDGNRVVQQANATFVYDREPAHSHNSFFWPQSEGPRFAEEYDWRWDDHLYAGWYFGGPDALKDVPEEHLHLVTEFGAQALPRRELLESIIPPGGLFPPDRVQYARRCFQWEQQLQHVAIGDSLDDFIQRSQEYQAFVVRYHVEFYRRRKFAPCNGAHVFCFNDCWPAISWSLVDYDRVPKAAYYALQRSMALLQVFADVLDRRFVVGEQASIPLWIVNDGQYAHAALRLSCTITASSAPGRVEWHSETRHIAIQAGGAVEQASLAWQPTEPGTVILMLRLESEDGILAENEYISAVLA